MTSYTFDALKMDVAEGRIDTVLACLVDMQGRLMGKRFQAEFFVESAFEETHSCNYVLATDMEMETVPGYKSSSWEKGYGDYTLKPDLSTLRKVPWLEGTALVLCDVLDHHTHEEVPHSPRALLKKQVARLEAMGLKAYMATELEFFLFDQTFDAARASGYKDLNLASGYNEDYHIFQTTKEEDVMRALRKGLQGAGIPVENSKGEASPGQAEINVRYAEALTMADRHAIIKNATKEIAWSKGKAVTFLAKWNYNAAGSSSHIHQSLWSLDGKPAFLDKDGEHGMSDVMRHYVAGLLAHASDITYFLAPTRASGLARLRRQRRSGASTTARQDTAFAARKPRASASNAVSAGPISIPISPWPLFLPRALTVSKINSNLSPLLSAMPMAVKTCARYPRHYATRPPFWTDRKCCARPLATTWSITTCMPRGGSRKNTTAA